MHPGTDIADPEGVDRFDDRPRAAHVELGDAPRPSRRREGHATAMLRAALPVAHGLGIDPALVTCDEDNVASRTVIEHARGRLIDAQGGVRRSGVSTSP